MRTPPHESALPPAPSAPKGAASRPELHFRLLEEIASPSLLIDADHEIVHLSESAEQYLQMSGGEPTRNLLRFVDPALRVEFRAALFSAAETGSPAEIRDARTSVGGEPRAVTIRVSPVRSSDRLLFLVVFQQVQRDDADGPDGAARVPSNPVAAQLDREIQRLKGQLRETAEQYEALGEELKASNAELQSMNEELRSATEELETGREELQSMNEELSTVNLELKGKLDELGQANGDLRNLMDATAIPTVFLDRHLCIARYTPAAIEVFNLIPADSGRPLTDLRNELDYPMLGSDAASVLDRLVPIEREISRAGEAWFLARMRPYRTLDDRIAGVVLTLVDITERRRAEAKLRASEERLRLIIENAREYAIFTTDPAGVITSWSPGAERVLGYAENDVVGSPLALIFTDDDVDAGVPAAEMAEALANGRAGDDRFHRRRDGSSFWSSGTLMPMRDASVEVVGFVKILRDETEARRQHEALEDSRSRLLRAVQENAQARRDAELQKEHLAALFTQTPLPICILRGPDYRVEFANAQVCEVWGRRHEEVIGLPVFGAVPASRVTVLRNLLDEVVRKGVAHHGREVRVRLDRRGTGEAEDTYLNFTYAPLRTAEGRIDGALVLGSDVTDEVQAREQMSALHDRAQEASRAKDDFLAMLSHELRNPLAPLRNSLRLLRERGDVSDDSVLSIAERQAGNLARIVGDLIEGARVREGRIDLRPERLDLNNATAQAIEAAREALEMQRHELRATLPGHALHANVDPVRYEQVLSNLLTNAGKYTPPGGCITVQLKRSGEMAELCVADTGIGISKQLRPRLFQMFQQGDRGLARQEGGLGLGLSIVRRIVELHGGTIDVTSEGPGRGSEFIVRLPLAGAAPAPAARSAPPATARAGAAPRRVLIVDDNLDAAETLQLLIEGFGHEARLATNGPSALQIVETWTPEIVFLDIGLPGMDGYEVARELRRRLSGKAAKLIALTGYSQDSDREKTHAAGFDKHLVKPADFDDIIDLLHGTAQHVAHGGSGSGSGAE